MSKLTIEAESAVTHKDCELIFASDEINTEPIVGFMLIKDGTGCFEEEIIITKQEAKSLMLYLQSIFND